MNLISLLSKNDASQTAAPEILQIPVAEIHPNPSQPRKSFSAAELVSLAKSISQVGLIEPLIVRHDTVGYELICGERRLKAAKLAGLSRVPCIVCDISDLNAALFSLIENLQRQDLNFFEQAEGFRLLIESSDSPSRKPPFRSVSHSLRSQTSCGFCGCPNGTGG